jgi:RNA polymerase sigma-70 factor, ECF subfamily
VTNAAEPSLLAAAGRGDEEAFRQLVEPLNREVLLFCYRMLGSFQDAEDALQEAFLKAWRRIQTFDGRSTFSTWLHSIATNTCLDLLKSRKRRILPQDVAAPITGKTEDISEWGQPAFDLPWLEPYPDAMLPSSDNPAAVADLRETVRLAYIRALQLLPARQRAVLILSDVLDWPALEVATALETSVPAVNSALQRARTTTSRQSSGLSITLDELSLDEHKRRIASKFVDAWEQGDIESLLALLTDDAIQTMPPMLAWFQGTEALRSAYAFSWDHNPRPGVFRAIPGALNGQLAWAFYYRPSGEGRYNALDIVVAELNEDGTLVREVTSFVNPKLFPRFGLAKFLPG